MSTTKILIAAAAGLVAGAAAALLTAPQSGSETRQKISDATGKLKNKLGKLIGKAGDELDELKNIIQTQGDGLTDDVRQRILKLIANTRASYNNVAAEASA